MSLYYSKEKFYDINSLELIYFYIPSYLMFNDQGFCFYPKYNITSSLDNTGKLIINIKEKESFIDLFKDEKINLKILCGQNGVGKTSLLKIMAKPNYIENKCIYVFKDKNDIFVASEKITIKKDNQEIQLDIIDYSFDGGCGNFCVTHENMGIEDFQFEKGITNFYKQKPELFKGILDGPLITGFNISIWSLEDKLNLLFNHNTRKELFNTESTIFSQRKFSSNVFLLYFLLQLEVSHNEMVLDSLVENWHEYDENQRLSFIDFLEEALPDIDNDKYDAISEKQIKLFEKDYLLDQINDIENDIRALFNSIKEFLFLIFGETDSSFPYNEFRDLLYYRGFNKNSGIKQFIELNYLSSGEYWSIRYRYEIIHSIIQHDGCWWYIDEPEKPLHPEWSRQFLFLYLSSYQKVKEYLKSVKEDFNPDKRFTLVFSTHSPFMLSDVTNDYVIYLEKDRETGITEEKLVYNKIFAGNIFDIYYDNMFITDTIGEFSRRKINYYLTLINNRKISSEDLKYFTKLVKYIGDDLLKSLLLEKINNYETNSNI